MSDLGSLSGAELGRSLRGIGVNLLCRDVQGTAAFLGEVFGLTLHRVSPDFALVGHGEALIQLHSDAAFARHPLTAVLPENPPRGAGVQIYLFGIDPDRACARAELAGGMVFEPPANKPHGLREATILGPEGHAFSPAVVAP